MDANLDFGRESVARRVGGGDVGAGSGAPAFAPAVQKYQIERMLGSGGMGEVFLATDHDLRRHVAMKVLRREIGEDPEARLQFVAEAQATSQLEHPGIPPVHDIGVAPDGRVWFTMKVVRGRTLAEVLHDVFAKGAEAQREWTLHRLIGVVERLSETLHFAHERGVVHRDVKPENVMLGDFGEVSLLDWGLARVDGTGSSSSGAPDLAEIERIATTRTETATTTGFGMLKGTLPYMAPEQLAGEVDRRTDVYALGCVLYEVLSLQFAYDAKGGELLHQVLEAAPVPVETRNLRRPVPAALAGICRRAMAKDPADRYPTTQAMGQALRAWLDGSSERDRRHAEAEVLAKQGQEAAAGYAQKKGQVSGAETAVEIEAAKVETWQPISEKRALLDAQKRVADLRTEVALAFAATTKLLDAALIQEQTNATARAALAALWKGRLEESERRGERADAAYALTMLSNYDDGALSEFAIGKGSLALASEPAGAEVVIHRFVERDGVLAPEAGRSLGQTPIAESLPMGSYLCVLTKPGLAEVRYPVHISRNRAWRGRVRMRTAEEIGEGFVLVPAGTFVFGDGKTSRALELGDFAIAKHQVTFGEYAEFLSAVEAEEGLPAAEARSLHGNAGDAPYMIRTEARKWSPRPGMIEGPPAERALRDHGPEWMRRLPVMCVTFDNAVAYCAWKTRTTGAQWRLPTEEEREKAARGVDGRRFPWGDLEDATLAKCRGSRQEGPQPEPVGSFKTAESVYGMSDAMGGMWEWTDSWLDARHVERVLRGGSWLNTAFSLRVAGRYSLNPSARNQDIGFRCARSL